MELSRQHREELLKTLHARFEKHMNRHQGLQWAAVQAKLEAHPDKLWSLHQMEITGGEPDVVAYDTQNDTYTFMDCVAESPKGRRSTCYDRAAQESRKENSPADSALGMAESMGVAVLDEAQYRALQALGHFDNKTSSWLKTPDDIRQRGGAIFGDYRYGHVFIYHNGAESYYAARGFRAALKV